MRRWGICANTITASPILGLCATATRGAVVPIGIDLYAAQSSDIGAVQRQHAHVMTLPPISLDPRSWLLLTGYVEHQEYAFTHKDQDTLLSSKVVRSPGASSSSTSPSHQEGGSSEAVGAYTRRRRQSTRASMKDLDALLDGDYLPTSTNTTSTAPSSSSSTSATNRAYEVGDLRVVVRPTFHTTIPSVPSLNNSRNASKNEGKYRVSANMSNKSKSRKFTANKHIKSDRFRAGSFDLDYIDRLAFADEQRVGGADAGGRAIFGVDEGVATHAPSGGIAELFVHTPTGWEFIPCPDVAAGIVTGEDLEFTSDVQRRVLLNKLMERVSHRADASVAAGVPEWLSSRIEAYDLQQPAPPPPPGWSQSILVPTGAISAGGKGSGGGVMITSRLFADLVPTDSLVTLLGNVRKQ